MYIYINILELDCTYPCAGLSGIVTACWLRSNCRLDPRGSKQMIKSQPKNHCKNELELNVTSTQHQAKHEPKNSTKFEPTSAQNRSQICPKSIKNRPKIGSGADLAPEAVFEPILVQFWLQLGAVLGGKMGSCWGHVGQKIDSWRILKAFKIGQDFQHLSGPSWDRFWKDFGVQNRTKIGPRSVSRAITKQMQRSSKSSTGAVFLRMRRIDKRSKINKKSF